MSEEKMIGLLESILKELTFHTKLMELQIDLIQSRQQDHHKGKKEMMDVMENLSQTVKGTPYESLLRGVMSQLGGKAFGGKKDGN